MSIKLQKIKNNTGNRKEVEIHWLKSIFGYLLNVNGCLLELKMPEVREFEIPLNL